jgi:hypothetical protein
VSKVLHVGTRGDAEPSCYVFEIEVRGGGRRRVFPPGFKRNDEAAAAPTEVMRAWFKRLGVTHVVSAFGNEHTDRACIADGRWKAKDYLAWWQESEEDE